MNAAVVERWQHEQSVVAVLITRVKEVDLEVLCRRIRHWIAHARAYSQRRCHASIKEAVKLCGEGWILQNTNTNSSRLHGNPTTTSFLNHNTKCLFLRIRAKNKNFSIKNLLWILCSCIQCVRSRVALMVSISEYYGLPDDSSLDSVSRGRFRYPG